MRRSKGRLPRIATTAIISALTLLPAGCKIGDEFAGAKPGGPVAEAPHEPGPGAAGQPKPAPRARLTPQEAARTIEAEVAQGSRVPDLTKNLLCKANDILDRAQTAERRDRIYELRRRAAAEGMNVTELQATRAVEYVDRKNMSWGDALRQAAFGIYCAV